MDRPASKGLANECGAHNKIENKIVILIDDVVTTGYTLYFAKHFLMEQGGASEVECMALTKSIS